MQKTLWLILGIITAMSLIAVADDDGDELGLPECELIVGANRYIEIGNTVSYTIEHMEQNKYRCEEFRGQAQEIVSCTYSTDPKFEVLLVVENGIVTEIESFQNGLECSYFNVKPLDPERSREN